MVLLYLAYAFGIVTGLSLWAIVDTLQWKPSGHPIPVEGLLWTPMAEYWTETTDGEPEYRRWERHRVTGAMREARWQPETGE